MGDVAAATNDAAANLISSITQYIDVKVDVGEWNKPGAGIAESAVSLPGPSIHQSLKNELMRKRPFTQYTCVFKKSGIVAPAAPAPVCSTFQQPDLRELGRYLVG